tara:strand:+ start:1080 stop:1829 length:750 start_codon:yes stop_codon:yes gene_type:complete
MSFSGYQAMDTISPTISSGNSDVPELCIPTFTQPLVSYSNEEHESRFNYHIVDSPTLDSRVSHNVNIFNPNNFISEYRIPTTFVGKAQEVQELVEDCFEKTLGKKMPDNIIIRICDKDEIKQVHEKFGSKWVDGIVGFAINRNKNDSISEIFIKEDSLDKVLVTIGHEIGHLLGERLSGRKEEAKAFAFELAWLQTIREHNIGGVGHNIIQINPANNGLHDMAFKFVIDLVRDGMSALEVFKSLVCSVY